MKPTDACRGKIWREPRGPGGRLSKRKIRFVKRALAWMVRHAEVTQINFRSIKNRISIKWEAVNEINNAFGPIVSHELHMAIARRQRYREGRMLGVTSEVKPCQVCEARNRAIGLALKNHGAREATRLLLDRVIAKDVKRMPFTLGDLRQALNIGVSTARHIWREVQTDHEIVKLNNARVGGEQKQRIHCLKRLIELLTQPRVNEKSLAQIENRLYELAGQRVTRGQRKEHRVKITREALVLFLDRQLTQERLDPLYKLMSLRAMSAATGWSTQGICEIMSTELRLTKEHMAARGTRVRQTNCIVILNTAKIDGRMEEISQEIEDWAKARHATNGHEHRPRADVRQLVAGAVEKAVSALPNDTIVAVQFAEYFTRLIMQDGRAPTWLQAAVMEEIQKRHKAVSHVARQTNGHKERDYFKYNMLERMRRTAKSYAMKGGGDVSD